MLFWPAIMAEIQQCVVVVSHMSQIIKCKTSNGSRNDDLKSLIYAMICVPADPDDECELPEGEAGIVWDAICFTVLLAQRRVFLSYYFLYVVSDLKSSKILASRSVLQ